MGENYGGSSKIKNKMPICSSSQTSGNRHADNESEVSERQLHTGGRSGTVLNGPSQKQSERPLMHERMNKIHYTGNYTKFTENAHYENKSQRVDIKLWCPKVNTAFNSIFL